MVNIDDFLGRKNIYIWGTGRNCDAFVTKLSLYISSGLDMFGNEWKASFKGYIDSSQDKIGKVYNEKTIVSPDMAIGEMDYCIITVSDSKEIIKYLEGKGYGEDRWITWQDYLNECRNVIMANKSDIDTHDNGKLSTYIRVLDEVSDGSVHDSKLSHSDRIAALEWCFESDIEGAEKLIKGAISAENNKKGKIHTVGILIDRLIGGGIEKVISLLVNDFSERGFHVVLLTDSVEDNSLSSDYVDAFIFHDKGGYFLESRLRDIEEAIKTHSIDVLCFHSGYARLETFYEVMLAKLLGIRVVIEIHSAFVALLKDQMGISSSFVGIYRNADRVVTVSGTDDWFWKCIGCRTVLIDNPVENFGVKSKRRRINKGGIYDIVWIGRIVQRPKNVLDAVKIIKAVHGKMENVRLRIIGMKDDAKVYSRLKEEVIGFDYVSIEDFRMDIENIYDEADVVLLTSASESFSNVLAEAKVYARPVVMYELPWLRLSKEHTGVWSVKQRDVNGAADAIVTLLEDTELWERYSQEAWDYIQWDLGHNVADDWMKLFADMENDVPYDSQVDDDLGNVIRLLLDQMYGVGYPKYSKEEAKH